MATTIGQAPIRDARTLGAPRMLVLGLQHMFAMFGATVLVPILVQSYGLPLSTQTTLFFAGFGTLFFHLCTKLEIPAFLGSSFAFLGGFSAMANLDTGKYAAMAPGEKLQYACGGIVVAGLLYVILALVVKVVGVHRVMRFLPPVVTGPIIILIGLNLAPSAVSNASTCWWLALVSMAIIVAANIWGRANGPFFNERDIVYLLISIKLFHRVFLRCTCWTVCFSFWSSGRVPVCPKVCKDLDDRYWSCPHHHHADGHSGS